MAKHHERRASRTFHAIVAILILLGGGGLLGFGVWMTSTGSGGPLNLEYSGDSFFNIVLSVNIGAIIFGGFLILTGIVSLITLSRQCIGIPFRVLYVVLATVILAILVLTCVISSMIVTQGDRNEVEKFIEEAWARTVTNSPDTICDLERKFNCRGFKDGDCTVCVVGNEVECTGTKNCALCENRIPDNSSVGCFDEILDSFQALFLPAAIISAILGSIVLADILVTWFL